MMKEIRRQQAGNRETNAQEVQRRRLGALVQEQHKIATSTRWVGGRCIPVDDAQDLIQTLGVRILERIDGIDGPTFDAADGVERTFRVSLRYRALDASKARSEAEREASDQSAILLQAEESLQPHERLLAYEAAVEVAAALGPDDAFAAFARAIGISDREVADFQAITPMAVRKRRQRAARALQGGEVSP